MERTRQVQAPITEDFIAMFIVFRVLDMNHGYHHFTLDEPLRKLMTFSTPWGNYRYKRLAFGGVNSQDLFDGEMNKIISGIPKVLNNRDDILVGGNNWDDHNANLSHYYNDCKCITSLYGKGNVSLGRISSSFMVIFSRKRD